MPAGSFYNTYDPKVGKCPDSPYGEQSYFYDFYIYNNGLAYQTELIANMNAPQGDAQGYLMSLVRRSIITSMTGISPSATWGSEVVPDMASTQIAINALSPFRAYWH